MRVMFARVRLTWIVLFLALVTQLFAQARSEAKYKYYGSEIHVTSHHGHGRASPSWVVVGN
jgi:hypothetical protein